MANTYFQFKQFTIHQDRCAMKVTTDACLFGAWAAERVGLARRSFSVGGSRACPPKLQRRQESVLPAEANAEAGGGGILQVLDIGAGTGLLSLMMAQKNPNCRIDAIEIDKAAAEQARENVAASPWADRIRIIQGDARQFEFNDSYDIIISNPPFYEKELKADDVKKNLARHNEGMLLSELAGLVHKWLRPGGFFYWLLPYKRYEDLRLLLQRENFGICEQLPVRQTEGHGYFRLMTEAQRGETALPGKINNGMSIMDENNRYTAVFTGLLQDFYLQL